MRPVRHIVADHRSPSGQHRNSTLACPRQIGPTVCLGIDRGSNGSASSSRRSFGVFRAVLLGMWSALSLGFGFAQLIALRTVQSIGGLLGQSVDVTFLCVPLDGGVVPMGSLVASFA